MLQQELKHALYAVSKSIWFCWYAWHPSGYVRERAECLKTPQGAFEFFVQCLLDQGVKADLLLNRVMPRLKESGYLNYSNLATKLSDPEKLKEELVEALGKSGYRMKNKGAKAIVRAVEVISQRYGNDIHNLYRYVAQNYPDDKRKIAEEVLLDLTKRGEFWWVGEKKAGIFIRDIIGYGVWDTSLEPIPPAIDSRVRRVLERLQLVKNRNNLKECRDAILNLACETNLSPIELDVALWTIGDEKICGEKKPRHDACPLKLFCPSRDKI